MQVIQYDIPIINTIAQEFHNFFYLFQNHNCISSDSIRDIKLLTSKKTKPKNPIEGEQKMEREL